jgi:nucleotide-binding universal stress UspA family protein
MPSDVKEILFATDFSAPSEAAYDVARELAGRCGASLTILHVVENPTAYEAELAPETGAQFDEVRAFVEAGLATRTEPLKKAGIPFKLKALIGSPREAIVTYANETGPDLIVLGTHRRAGGFERVALGSVAGYVVRTAGRPVLVVPTSGEEGVRSHP